MNSIHYVKWEGKKGQAGLQGNACSKRDVEGLRRWRSLMSPRGAAWPKARVIESLGMAFGLARSCCPQSLMRWVKHRGWLFHGRLLALESPSATF